MTVSSIRPVSPAGTPPLSVLADLRIEMDGHRAHLVGEGQSLILHTDRPLRMWAAVNRASLPAWTGRLNGPRAVGRAATGLRSSGLSIDVRGPDGVLVRLGDGVGSSVGRLLTGSSAVGFGSVRALSSTVTARIPVRRIALYAAAAIATVAVVAVLRRRG